MRFAIVILSALLCLQLNAETSKDEKSDEALVAAAEKLIAEGRTESTVDAPVRELSESEIPVVISAKKAGGEKGGNIWRVLASLGVIAVTAAVVLYASKRWTRGKDKGGQKARIEMMHQFHLGPRKSVALIRVSGEAMLIGVTDHNINMIKAVTLIDDELEHVMGKDFNNFLEDEFSIEDVRSALGPRV